MISKAIAAILPLFSIFAPVCSTPFSPDIMVFASLMKDNPYRPNDEAQFSTATLDPKEIHFDDSMRVMSFNVLFDGNEGEHSWKMRQLAVVSMIRFHHADLIGLQEPSNNQLEDIKNALPEFGSFSGIYNPILYRKSRLEFVSSGAFYLSSTPNIPSTGWDAKFPRAVSWVKLKDKKLGQEFFFFNTHFDYHGENARNESAKLLQKKVEQIARGLPYVVSGDFNIFPRLGGESTYQILTETFRDAQISSEYPHHGPTGTWSGFKQAGQPGVKPDCIFVGPTVDVYLHGVLSDTFDGQFPSDHLPVVADLFLCN